MSMKILVVDADIMFCKKIEAALKQKEYEVIAIHNGGQALELLKEGHSFDAIITDIKLPSIDSLGILRYVRNSLRYKNIPIILTTALNDHATIVKVAEYGVAAYLLKPLEVETIMSTLEKVINTLHGSILVVDDEEIIRSLLTKVIEREGYRVATAVDGLDALRVLKEQPVSIVISDIKMPNMTGTELLVQVKEDHPDIPVLLMTGFSLDFTKQEAIASGADDYITKPFKNIEIMHKIRLCLMNSKKQMAKN